MVCAFIALSLLVSCSASTELDQADEADPTPLAASVPEAPSAPNNAAPAPDQGPVAYVPAGRPGSAQAYASLVDELHDVVPADLRSQVPWPDLRNPNPIVAQTEIFDLWIWMTENLTEPQLVEMMAAPGSPSRELIVSVFGDLQRQNVFEVRPGQPYKAFDHLVVTFESAGLPLWLARDVPDDAVVVYYSDSSGPVDIVDQDTKSIVRQQAGVPTRAWLSIMVPTDVGWQLWRDQLIEPNDAELETPDVPPPPGADSETRTPEL